ncbi:unnamed protein product [Albugo candida]|uniref:Uncharacterized protein n=1 Tax=Albugo candida TaxID=65357 RepID=A0A024GSE7_9STRA|nr:unnamed protein product [Albugo candida]|eukprot:CCI49457.1 unnamed protein product [Albugo candida]
MLRDEVPSENWSLIDISKLSQLQSSKEWGISRSCTQISCRLKMHYHEFFILSPRTNFLFRSRAYTSIGETTHGYCASFSTCCENWIIIFLDAHVALPIQFLTIFDILLDLVCRRTNSETCCRRLGKQLEGLQQQMPNYKKSLNGYFLKKTRAKGAEINHPTMFYFNFRFRNKQSSTFVRVSDFRSREHCIV